MFWFYRLPPPGNYNPFCGGSTDFSLNCTFFKSCQYFQYFMRCAYSYLLIISNSLRKKFFQCPVILFKLILRIVFILLFPNWSENIAKYSLFRVSFSSTCIKLQNNHMNITYFFDGRLIWSCYFQYHKLYVSFNLCWQRHHKHQSENLIVSMWNTACKKFFVL